MQEDQPVPGTDPEGRKRGRGDPGREQGGGGRILCSGRGGSHPGRVPDAVKQWKNERGKRYGLDTGYYSSSRDSSGRNSRTRMRSGVQSK